MFATLLAFTACLMAPKENITAYDGHRERWKIRNFMEGWRKLAAGLWIVGLETFLHELRFFSSRIDGVERWHLSVEQGLFRAGGGLLRLER